MKATLSAVALCLALVGCDTMPKRDAEVIIKQSYIVLTVPADMLTVPEPMPKLDTTKATDAEAANWLIDSEKRALTIEDKLKAIKQHQDKRLEEVKKLPADSVIIK